jgi:hypothetical protein
VNFRAILTTGLLLVAIIVGYIFVDLRSQLTSANNQSSLLKTQLSAANSQITSLQDIITPEMPTHNIGISTSIVSSVPAQLKNAAALQISASQDKITTMVANIRMLPFDRSVESAYWNTAWAGKDYELQQIAQEVNVAYYNSHAYIANEIDCVDMACEIWDILQKQGIRSLIAVGNLEMIGENFGQCNHAWLMIPNSTGMYFALEATNGQLYFADSPSLVQYTECFLYAKPSDLRADIGSRW